MTPAKTYTREQIEFQLRAHGISEGSANRILDALDQPPPAEPEFVDKYVDTGLSEDYDDQESAALRFRAKLILDLVESKVKQLRDELTGDGRK